ncbi:hypothetical protein [Solibacillus sp. CAU 1738]
MTYKLYLDQVQNKYPYTYESIADNDDAYLHEEQCDETLDQFDDNDL